MCLTINKYGTRRQVVVKGEIKIQLFKNMLTPYMTCINKQWLHHIDSLVISWYMKSKSETSSLSRFSPRAAWSQALRKLIVWKIYFQCGGILCHLHQTQTQKRDNALWMLIFSFDLIQTYSVLGKTAPQCTRQDNRDI